MHTVDCQVEFQHNNTHYVFAEAEANDCDIRLFDSARHQADVDAQQIDSHGRGAVFVFNYRGRDYVLRPYRRGGMMRHLSRNRYLWRGVKASRPMREFALLKLMQEHILPSPRPYACCVQQHGLSCSGSLITELIPHTCTLAERLSRYEIEDAQWRMIGQVIRQFHDTNICHSDLNAHNILLDRDAQVYLIDFDNSAQKKNARGWKFDNLKRLQRSIMKCWMQADTFYFSPASWEHLRDGYLGDAT